MTPTNALRQQALDGLRSTVTAHDTAEGAGHESAAWTIHAPRK